MLLELNTDEAALWLKSNATINRFLENLGSGACIKNRTYQVIVQFVPVSFDPTDANTGGKGSITQWVHVEYMEGSETIRATFTQWVRGGYFSKVPTKVPTG